MILTDHQIKEFAEDAKNGVMPTREEFRLLVNDVAEARLLLKFKDERITELERVCSSKS